MKALSLSIASVGILLSHSAIASIVEYTLDSSTSFVTVSGTFEGIPLSEQTLGSSTAHYGGTFFGNLENGLLALEGNNIVALFQPVPQLPIRISDNGGLGAYGFRIETPNSGQVLIAISGISFFLNTNFRPPLNVADGFFTPADVGFFLHGDTLLFSTSSVPYGGVDLHGFGAPNQAALPGTFTPSADVETLTIPILTTVSRTALSPDDLSLTFSGQIVATRSVPEPTAALLLLCGCVALIRNGRYRPCRAEFL